jgi:hypothetical protein
MKKYIFTLCIGIFGIVSAQIPTGYYDGTDGLTGAQLKTKLSQIATSGHQDKGYNGVSFLRQIEINIMKMIILY